MNADSAPEPPVPLDPVPLDPVPLDPAADYRAWRLLAPAGLLLVGAGTAVSADASTRRAARAATARWVGEGTLGLVLLNAGLSLFGEAVKRRARYDIAISTPRAQDSTATPRTVP